jgi:hypothetical protein
MNDVQNSISYRIRPSLLSKIAESCNYVLQLTQHTNIANYTNSSAQLFNLQALYNDEDHRHLGYDAI